MLYIYQTVFIGNIGFISLFQCWNDGEPLRCANECLSVLFVIVAYCVLMQYDYGGGKKMTKYIFIQVSFFNVKLKFAYIFLDLTLYQGYMSENRAI